MTRGRPRQYDEGRVLGQAAQLFRERGFHSTSTQALSKAMGMGEQSIFNAFGSKEKLFERALQHYCNESEAALQELTIAGASREAIEAIFSMVVDAARCDTPACLVMQTCVTFGADDTGVARKAAAHIRKIEKYLHKAVLNAVEKGESHCDDPRTVARFLNMSLQGLSVMARSGTSKKALRAIADLSLEVLH